MDSFILTAKICIFIGVPTYLAANLLITVSSFLKVLGV